MGTLPPLVSPLQKKRPELEKLTMRFASRSLLRSGYLAVNNASDASVAPVEPVAVANVTTAEPAWVEGTALWFAQDGIAEGACKQVHT